jgi:hypothetical protein
VHHIIIKPKIWCGMSFPVGHIIYNLISPGHSSLLIVLHIGFCQKKILIFSTRIIHTYDVLFLKTTHLAVAVGSRTLCYQSPLLQGGGGCSNSTPTVIRAGTAGHAATLPTRRYFPSPIGRTPPIRRLHCRQVAAPTAF